jgi:type I restriction enzyme S subunit
MSRVPLSAWLSDLESGARPKGGIKDGVGDIPSLGAEHLAGDGGFNFSKDKRIPRDFFESMTKGRIRRNDILIVKDGATTGKVSFVGDDFPYEDAAINEHIFLVRVSNNLADPKFVFRYLQTPQGQSEIMRDFRGATVGGIGRTFVEKVTLPKVAVDEQRRIATILDKADAIRRKRERALTLADDFLRSLFNSLFGDLTRLDGPWQSMPMSQLCTKITDGTHKTPRYLPAGIPFLSAKNIRIDGLDWDSVKFISVEEHRELTKRCNPEIGDILLSKSGSLGTAAIVDRNCEFSLFESAALLKPKVDLIEPHFLRFLLNSETVKRLLLKSTKGVAIKHLHLVDIRGLTIQVPPLDLQREFVRSHQAVERVQHRFRNGFEASNLFESLSQRAFAGDL